MMKMIQRMKKSRCSNCYSFFAFFVCAQASVSSCRASSAFDAPLPHGVVFGMADFSIEDSFFFCLAFPSYPLSAGCDPFAATEAPLGDPYPPLSFLFWILLALQA